jgi:hypothetical protein
MGLGMVEAAPRGRYRGDCDWYVREASRAVVIDQPPLSGHVDEWLEQSTTRRVWYPRDEPGVVFRPRTHKTPGKPGVLLEADEGIRTLDLRHGKATL